MSARARSGMPRVPARCCPACLSGRWITAHAHARASPLPRPGRRYELHSEWEEALDHAADRGRNVKILLRVTDVGEQY